MFLILNILAIATAIDTIILRMKGQKTADLRFTIVSLTSLTVCAFYRLDVQYVTKEDWSALIYVTHTVVTLC